MKKFPLIILIALIALLIRLQNAQFVFGYMLPYEYDPFYHLRLAEVIVYSGYRPDFDYYLNYPYGLRIDWLPLFDYLIAFPGILLGYKAMLAFSFILPVILGVISTVLIYYIARKFAGNEAALLSALIFAVCPIVVNYSVVGFADHHAWNLFLFILSILLILTKPILASIPLLLLSLSWVGAPIYAAVLAIASLFHFRRDEIPKIAIAFAVPAAVIPLYPYIGISFLAISAFLALGYFAKNEKAKVLYIALCLVAVLIIYLLPFQQLWFFKSGIDYIFSRNVYLPTIAEARSFEIIEILFDVGFFAFILAIIGTLASNRFLQVLFLSAFALSLMQIRFAELLSIPVAVMAGRTYQMVMNPAKSEKEKKSRIKRREDKKKNKVKSNEKRRLRDRLAIAAFAAFIVSPSLAVSIYSYTLSEDWFNALNWLREETPQTSHYFSPQIKPEYSVLSWWDYGNWIVFVSKRPVVANNFQAGADDAAKFFVASDEEAAFEIAKKRGVRYIITDEIMGLKQSGGAISGKFPAIMSIAGYKINNIRMGDLFDVYNKSIYYRLHVENASNLTHFKLLKDFGSVKIFQVTN
jgi:asparagine N-glycosylation enzyme membrane subunit Stt3